MKKPCDIDKCTNLYKFIIDRPDDFKVYLCDKHYQMTKGEDSEFNDGFLRLIFRTKKMTNGN